jgi:hypothetical protein
VIKYIKEVYIGYRYCRGSLPGSPLKEARLKAFMMALYPKKMHQMVLAHLKEKLGVGDA